MKKWWGGAKTKISPQQVKKKRDLKMDNSQCMEDVNCSGGVGGSGGQNSLCKRNTRETNGEMGWGKNLLLRCNAR